MIFFTKRKKRLLVVDDSEIDLILVESMLQDKYTVLPTNSGKEALDFLLHADSPDLILLDLIMPDMDGWETFSQIRALSSISHIPISFLTSEDGTAEQNRAREIGAADYILKPFTKKGLEKRVKAILKKFPLKKEKPKS